MTTDHLFPLDVTSLYPSAMSLMDSIYRRSETIFVITKNMKDELGNRFNKFLFGIKSTEDLTAISGIFKKFICLPRNYNCVTSTC